MSNEQYFG